MISIIHPSRNRILMAYDCYKEWMDNATNKKAIQYILSVDIDDPALLSYAKFSENTKMVELLVSENKNVVDAMNNGAAVSDGGILVCVSDDFSCFKGWDEWVLENINHENEEALGINDGLQPSTNIIMTMPILTRKLYQKLGCIYDERFIGMYADNWLAEKCVAMGVYKSNRSKVFYHKHWATGLRKKDETNLRHDNPESWTKGFEVLKQERLNNFGIKKQYV